MNFIQDSFFAFLHKYRHISFSIDLFRGACNVLDIGAGIELGVNSARFYFIHFAPMSLVYEKKNTEFKTIPYMVGSRPRYSTAATAAVKLVPL